MSLSTTVSAETAAQPVSVGSRLRSVSLSTSFGEARRSAFGAKAAALYVVA
jgi:hypothetical protein